jgi:hypothetical protein
MPSYGDEASQNEKDAMLLVDQRGLQLLFGTPELMEYHGAE